MKKKEKVVKDPWCPLTGDIGPHDNLILRARDLWGVRHIVEDNIFHAYRPNKADIEKARKIYDRWDEYQHDPMRIKGLELNLSMALDPGRREQARQESLKDITLLFYGLDASIQEVFSVLAIYEARRVSKNPAWPLELLAMAKEYSPDALRGKRVINGAIGSGNARREQVKEEREEIWEDLQKRAEKIWGKNPRLSKLQTASRIYNALIKEDPAEVLSVSTIRQRIKKK